MLQSLRTLSKSWIFKGLMALLMVSFAIWGVGDIFRTHPGQREVARVGEISIPVQALDFRFQVALPEARQTLGPDLTPAQAKQMGLLDRTLNMLVEEASFDQEVNRLDLKLNDSFIFQQIARMPEMRDETGRFNEALWRQVVGKSGLSERFFIQEKKKDMLRKLLLQTFVANAQPPKTLVDNLYRARGAKRVLEVVALRSDSQKDFPPPTADELKQFYEENEEQFTTPEYRGFTVARLLAEDVAKDVSVSDDDLRKAYETRGADFTRPEQRELVQLIFQDEAKARAFYDSLKTASSFADAARAKGLTPVSLGKMDEKTILPELYAPVFGLQKGEASEPVQTALGWHVVWVKNIIEGGKPSFDNVKEELRAILRDERLGDVLTQGVNRLDDDLAAGKALEDIADSLKLRLMRVASVDSSGKTPDGKAMEAFPEATRALEAAFSLGVNEAGQVLEDGKGNYFVVRTDKIEPSRLPPFEEIEPKVKALWTTARQSLEAAKAAEAIAERMRKGEPATRFAAEPGVSIRLSKPISQLGETDKELPPGVLDQVFAMKKGDVIVAAGKTRSYVMKLVDIVPVDPKRPGPARLKIVDELNELFRAGFLEQYALALRKDFPVRIRNDVLESMKN